MGRLQPLPYPLAKAYSPFIPQGRCQPSPPRRRVDFPHEGLLRVPYPLVEVPPVAER